MLIKSCLETATEMVAKVVRPGDTCIDATAGNGNDTLLLARLVGAEGRVYGFDVQEQALNAARALVESENLTDRVELIQDGHEKMVSLLPTELKNRVAAVMFNLGYLPGYPEGLRTRPASTIAALRASMEFIRPGGIITVLLYAGHAGAEDECKAVLDWASGLDQKLMHVLWLQRINQINRPPHLLVIEKRDEKD